MHVNGASDFGGKKCKIEDRGSCEHHIQITVREQVWCRLDLGGLGGHRIVPFATCFLEAPCGGFCSADNHPVLLRTGKQLSLCESS